MAPVIAALPVIIQMVAVVSSAVTMIKGLKEGNLLMAVVGGVGAAAGLGALSAGLTAGATAASTAGAGATGAGGLGALGGLATTPGGLVVNNAAGALGGAGNLASAAAGAASPAAGFSLNALSNVGSAGKAMNASLAAGPQAAQSAGAGLIGSVPQVSSQATGVVDKTLAGLGKIGDFAVENKDVLANVGGGLMKGYAAGKMKEEEMDWQDRTRRENQAREDRNEEARRSRAASTAKRGSNSYKWAGSTPAVEGGAA